MKIVWSPKAVSDLGRIIANISQDKRETALQWAKKIEGKVSRLKKYPRSGRVVPELGREEIREILIGSYRVIYKVEKLVAILTLFHGAKGSLDLD